jgi:hypothetical protein
VESRKKKRNLEFGARYLGKTATAPDNERPDGPAAFSRR